MGQIAQGTAAHRTHHQEGKPNDPTGPHDLALYGAESSCACGPQLVTGAGAGGWSHVRGSIVICVSWSAVHTLGPLQRSNAYRGDPTIHGVDRVLLG